jgi:hypothetical protein
LVLGMASGDHYLDLKKKLILYKLHSLT